MLLFSATCSLSAAFSLSSCSLQCPIILYSNNNNRTIITMIIIMHYVMHIYIYIYMYIYIYIYT